MRGLDASTWEAIVRARESARLPLRPEFFEKDYLVAEAVEVIARVGRERGARLVFCGGTALSQAHQLIDRMSEDIDFRVVLPELPSKTQQRKFLSALKDDLTRAMDEAGFPLDGDLRARNNNSYIHGRFGYASRVTNRAETLRPWIKVELIVFAPIAPTLELPVRPLLERVLELAPDPNREPVEVLNVVDTLADKVVGYLRRTAADRAGCGMGDYDDRLVRHLYDVHAITTRSSDSDALIAQVAPLFAETIERDRVSYGNQFPAFAENPRAVLEDELSHLSDDEVRDRYRRFCEGMLIAPAPSFEEVTASFRGFATAVLEHELTARVRRREQPDGYAERPLLRPPRF